jgi:hypothetical protein
VRDSDTVVGVAQGMEGAAAQDSNHVEDSNAEESRSHLERLGMLEALKSDVRG